MLHFDILSAFILTAVGFTLAPGPDMLFLLTQSVTSGWRKGFATATGLVTAPAQKWQRLIFLFHFLKNAA